MNLFDLVFFFFNFLFTLWRLPPQYNFLFDFYYLLKYLSKFYSYFCVSLNRKRDKNKKNLKIKTNKQMSDYFQFYQLEKQK